MYKIEGQNQMRWHRVRRALCILAFSGLVGGIFGSEPLQAQIQRSTINPGWEENDPPGNPDFLIYNDADVPGWENTTNKIEIWDTNFESVPSAEGVQHAELNADSSGTTYQEICLVAGDEVDWAFYHRPRVEGVATQSVTLEIADLSGNVVDTITTSNVTDTSTWALRQGASFPFTGSTGTYRFQFTTTNSGSNGNFLDGIDITVLPHVEFTEDTTSIEGVVAPDLPSVAVSGRFYAPLVVPIQITGGTATLGVDYTTPTGTNTFNLVIPAGTYQAEEFALPLTVNTSDGLDSGETIDFAILPTLNDYTISSLDSCGAPAQSTTTHTIIEEADLVTTKTLVSGNASPATGETVTFEIKVTNNGPLQATDVSLSDLLPDGLTLTPNNGGVSQGIYDAATGLWTIGVIEGGDTVTLTIEGDVDPDQGGQTIENTTSAATGAQTDPEPTGDTLSSSVTVPAAPGLEIEKTADDDEFVTVGQTITYTYNVTNTGNLIVRDVSISDVHNAAGPAPVPAGEVLTTDGNTIGDSTDAAADDGTWSVLAPGDVVTFTGTYTVKQADIDNLQ